MGDMAEGLINGDFDFHTGEYIGHGYGYPRTKERVKNYNPKAGVTGWLTRNGVKDRQRQIDLLRAFVGGNTSNMSKYTLCCHASERFGEFMKYVKTQEGKG